MKNKYYHYLDVMLGHPFTIYLPLQVQPIVNGENGEPRDIEAKDVENLNVRIKGVGETGIGKQAPFEVLYNYVIVHVPASFDEGDVVVHVSGNYGQVCLDASVCAHVKRAGGGLGGILPPYVSPVVGDCGTIADIAPLPLCFTNRGSSMVGLGLNLRDDSGEEWKPNLEISFNGVDWVDFDENYGFQDPEEQDHPVHLAVGMSVYFRGMNPDGFNRANDEFGDNQFVNFVWSNSEADVSVSGDIASLINYEKRVPFPVDAANFTYLFGRYDDDVEEYTSLVDASDLIILSADSYWCLSFAFYSCNSLVNAPALPATALAERCYKLMFAVCPSLVTAPALPATALNEGCYESMFSRCTSLVTAPALPAKELETSCYRSMFQRCTSLVNVPALPATALAESCYESMFGGCTSIVNAPALPAKTLAGGCYKLMFDRCTSLVNAPVLPAKELETICYAQMFEGCASLVNAPVLPAVILARTCYDNMFHGCTSLVTAPALPATRLADNCYSGMFRDCTSLVNAPALPARTLATNCYRTMFEGCASLVNAPALPATTLASYCYAFMFSHCTSLVTAPALPAKTLVSYCYQQMFQSCTALRYIEMLAVALSPTNAVTNWVQGVPTGHAGTFVKNAAATWTTSGNSGVPTNWGIIYKQV